MSCTDFSVSHLALSILAKPSQTLFYHLPTQGLGDRKGGEYLEYRSQEHWWVPQISFLLLFVCLFVFLFCFVLFCFWLESESVAALPVLSSLPW